MTESKQSESFSGDLDFTAVDRALERLYRARAAVGLVPPGPATARGRVGAALIRGVRRALFWLLPQLDTFHGAVIEYAEAQTAMMEELRGVLQTIDAELDDIAQRLQVEAGVVSTDQGGQDAGSLWLRLVRCQAVLDLVRREADGKKGTTEQAPV
jgi:hypothetical protein